MKKSLAILFISIVTISSCTKGKDDDKPAQPASYEEIKYTHIAAREAELTETIIPISGLNGLKLQAGTVLIFKTVNNRFGKIRVNSIDPAQNYLMNISARVYTNSLENQLFEGDKTIKAEINSLNIRGTFGCDLDSLLEVNGIVTQDFWIQRVNATDTDFRPVHGAKFAKYNF